MSKEVNRIAIGGFVVGGIGLAVLALLVFGSGEFFQHKSLQVLFFQGSVKGLSVGDPVKFRGVDIGEVKKIELTLNSENLEFYVPVYVQIYRSRFSILGGKNMAQFDNEKVVDALVTKMGLRGQLQMQSFLTGQLFINYDFDPGTPIRRVGLDKNVYEVPTIPTALQMLTDTLEEFVEDLRKANFREIVDNIAQTARGANELMNSADLRESVAHLNKALQDVQKFVEHTDELVAKVNGRFDSAADGFEATMQDTRRVMQNIDKRVEPVASDIQNTLEAARSSFEKAERVMIEARELISANSMLRQEIMMTLESLSDASRSLEELTDYLQRHPEAVITGKK
jgi:paraquat-inducible protein B